MEAKDDYFPWQAFPDYSAANELRARGEAPIKESHKSAIKLLKNEFPEWLSIVDVGCSSGHFLTALRALEPSRKIAYTGIDMDNQAIERALNVFSPTQDSFVRFCQGDIEALPFPDNSFDVSISMNVLEHLASPVKAILEMWRVSRYGALLRTYISPQTYLIREVRNRDQWSKGRELYATAPHAEGELDDSGEPFSCVYQNIWGRDYLEKSLANRLTQTNIRIIEDSDFDESAIN